MARPLLHERASLAQTASDRIEVELIVAKASTPIEAMRDIARLGADVGVAEFVLAEEQDGTWRVESTTWRLPAASRPRLALGR